MNCQCSTCKNSIIIDIKETYIHCKYRCVLSSSGTLKVSAYYGCCPDYHIDNLKHINQVLDEE